VIGFYSNGCVAGAQALPETGPTWQAMRLSRNRNWGHPELIDYVTGLSRQVAATTSWSGLYVGDMSQPRGGPMRRAMSATSPASTWISGCCPRATWPERAGARKPQLHFHAVPARRVDFRQLDRGSRAGPAPRRQRPTGRAHLRRHRDQGLALPERDRADRGYLNRIRPANGHHYHFHVRLACPAGSRNCEEQEPPEPGDGCAEAEARREAILNPPPPVPDDGVRPPPGPPRGNRVTLGQVPRQCLTLLSGLDR
jgi:penicillin-insensitive murein endopeptidase